jgi:hypothetical protein
MFITGVVDTGDKPFSGVNDTGETFIAVSLTLAINLCHGSHILIGGP